MERSDITRPVHFILIKLQAKLLSLGATIHSFKYPTIEAASDKKSSIQDVILGFDSSDGYDGTKNSFFWGTTGRLTNR